MTVFRRSIFVILLAMFGVPSAASADPALVRYLHDRTKACAEANLVDFKNPDQWPERRAELRRQIQDMLGLNPWPARGDLKAVVTGSIERGGIVVEKLHFQSSPGLYVTANFYRPAKVEQPLPTILYLCGHGKVVENGISLGNKVAYQHHGAWFARNGYCCLTIDTIQLGEIEGLHHGTNREGMWWWISRGYTPAGVEAWNSLRALDYLETRREVDAKRIGVTGRSGGGAYSWWVAALDDRPICFVPVAGITDLTNHVVDDCIEGHCDCMYQVNRLGWDYGTLACLAAPRPCLLANSDRDRIFPLDGVLRVHSQMRSVYRKLKAEEKLGLTITEGPHKDTQELQLAAFRWLNRWLRGVDEPVAMVAEKLFAPAELKVFDTLPSDEKVTSIHETFVPAAPAPEVPSNVAQWEALRAAWLDRLRSHVFSAWPSAAPALAIHRQEVSGDTALKVIEFTSEPGLRLSLTVAQPGGSPDDAPVVLHIVGEDRETYLDRAAKDTPAGETWAFFAPRGCDDDPSRRGSRTRAHFLRRFVLVGTTIDEGRVWDIVRAVAALRETVGAKRSIVLAGRGQAAGLAVYASLFAAEVSELRLQDPPASHRDGPTFIGVLRVLDMPQALAMALPRRIELHGAEAEKFAWTAGIARLYPQASAAGPLEFVPKPQTAQAP